ncbi:MAG: aminoglycoside phosphotransferase family protein [Lachnospiraceae bacterium]|nr:aminoglycoside phosphotransferase family protein [Lachnospiraceae bacterium]
MGITKNHLSDESIKNIFSRNFPNKKITQIKELTEGMFNAAYSVSFEDGSGSILKVAPPRAEGLMSNEINMMAAEVQAMRIMRDYDFVHIAEVQSYDTSKRLCSSDYLIMERIEGENWLFIKDEMPEEVKNHIYYEIGIIQKKMSEIEGNGFGLLGDDRRFDSLYDFLYMLLQNVLHDVEAKNIGIGVTKQAILERLEKDQMIFDEVKVPTLVHWDMWEGNIFVKNNHVSGVIDWERAMWGEPFMDDRFRQHSRKEAFLKGFGQTDFSENEKRRLAWYDMLLYITMMAEVTYRQYPDGGQYDWAKSLFEGTWKCISE